MSTCHSHNLREPESAAPKPYGVRVSLRAGDPFRKLLGADWSRTHWFERGRRRAARRGRQHEYSRPGDRPALNYEKVVNLASRRRD